MNATSSAGAVMAASGIEKVRPSYGRGTQAARDARLHELLAAHLQGGGTINAFARIHRIHTGAVGALRASLPPMGPVTTRPAEGQPHHRHARQDGRARRSRR